VVCSTLLVADGHATLWDIATAPDHRRRGYGAAIVRKLVDEAIHVGCRTGSLNSSALGRSMYMALGFEREVDDTDLRFVLLPSVLRARRGSCVGLGSLYLALGEHLHLPLEGVMLPGHFFVRLHDRDRVRNIELLRRGEQLPDDWYRQRFPLPPEGAREYARALSLGEVLAIVAYDPPLVSERLR
jgi:regulator of sirC expression with transglutaminase-like and TPR domain